MQHPHARFRRFTARAGVLACAVLAPLASGAEPAPESLTVAHCADCAPAQFLDEQGRPAGILIELWRLWSERTGIEVRFRPAPWPDTLALVRAGEADAHAGLFRTPERDTYLDFASQLVAIETHVFAHSSFAEVPAVDGLAPFRVGVIADDSAEWLVRRESPDAVPVVFPDYESLLAAVAAGDIRIFVADTSPALHHLARTGLREAFRHRAAEPAETRSLWAAVGEGEATLAREIAMGMAGIAEAERARIERRWLPGIEPEEGGAVVVALKRDLAPLSFVTGTGEPAGLLVDVWRAWASATGRDVEFLALARDEVFDAVHSGRADALTAPVNPGKKATAGDAATTGVFTGQTFHSLHAKLHVPAGEPRVSTIADLGDPRVAVVGPSALSNYLAGHPEEARWVEHPTYESAVRAVLAGEADALLGWELVVREALDRLGLNGRLDAGERTLFVEPVKTLVHGEDSDLREALGAWIGTVATEDLDRLADRWVEGSERRDLLRIGRRNERGATLSRADRARLDALDALRVAALPDARPLAFHDDGGAYVGLAVDYLEHVAGDLGEPLRLVHGLDRAEALARLAAGELEIVPGIRGMSPEVADEEALSAPYHEAPNVIVTRSDAQAATDIAAFAGRAVAIGRAPHLADYIEREHPGIEVRRFPTRRAALHAVADGEADAAVGDLDTMVWVMRAENLQHLKIAGVTPYRATRRFAVRPDWPGLADLVSGSLARMEESEHARIRERWSDIEIEPVVDYTLVRNVSIAAAGALAIGLGWLWRLQRQKVVLRRNEARLRRVVESSPVGAGMVDEDGTLRFANPRLAELAGATRDELKGRPLSDAIDADGDARSLVARICRGERVRAQELTLHNGCDDAISVLLSAEPLDDDSGTRSFVWAYDISEQKRHARELAEARDRAEAANAAKSTFLATMSHEIRTPMNGVLGMIDVLRTTELDPEQRDMVRPMRESALSLLQIIDDILDLSKIEADKLELEHLSFSVRDCVEQVARMLAPSAGKKGLRLLTWVDPSIPEQVRGDPVRVRQILFNLGGNAVKFTGAGEEPRGQVILRADHAGTDAGGRVLVRYAVADNGIGVPPEKQDLLFRPFSQVEASTTREYGGTGLGLSICARLADLMGGTVGLESAPGRGSTFHAEVPHGHADDASDGAAPERFADLRVLVAEPIEDTSGILTGYLAHWGAKVVATPDPGEVAVRADAESEAGRPFDLVVLGPGAGTAEQESACARIRDDGERERPRIVRLLDGSRPGVRVSAPDTVEHDANPLTRSGFASAIAVATGRASPDPLPEAADEAADESGGVATASDAEPILVAEDNPTNREVIRRQLERLGYRCDVQPDGEAALAAWRGGTYSLVLTDVHMPRMDGLALAGAIRAEEAEEERVPILALTANALESEAERSLAAGMDECLVKPIELSKLRAALARRIVSRRTGSPEPSPVSPAEPAERADRDARARADPRAHGSTEAGPVNVDAIREFLGDDDELIEDLLRDFVEPARANAREIRDAWQQRSAADVSASAHKLKSSARTVGAEELAELCLELETAGKRSDWNRIDAAAPRLDTTVEEVARYVEEHA